MERVLLALVCRPGVVPRVPEALPVVQVVREGAQLDGEDHLRAGEVEVPTQVVEELPVEVPKHTVKHRKGGHQGLGLAEGKGKDQPVGSEGRDEVVDPLDPNRVLKKKSAHQEGENVPREAKGKLQHDQTQGVRQEETEGVAHRLLVHANEAGQGGGQFNEEGRDKNHRGANQGSKRMNKFYG